jgi:ribose-phosphate pyrophosphokinase
MSDLEKIAIYDLSPLDEGVPADHNPNTKFSRNVCAILEKSPSPVEVATFSDGDRDPIVSESVRGRKIFVFQSHIAPIGERKYELELFIDSVTPGGCNREDIVVVWPYAFGQRGEKRTRPRQAATTLVFAKCLRAFDVDTLLTGTLHNESVELVYNAYKIYVEHMNFAPIAVNYIIRNYRDAGKVGVLSPDAGGLKRVQKIEKILNGNPAKSIEGVKSMEGVSLDVITRSADKIRTEADVVVRSDLLDDVAGLDVLIVDDIADTLGTLKIAAENCRKGGAKSVRALCYHASLGKGYEKNMGPLLDENILDELILGNTIPIKDYARNHPKVKILPLEPLFAEAIKNIYNNSSMSELHNYGGVMKVYNKARFLYKKDPKYVKIESSNLPTLKS